MPKNSYHRHRKRSTRNTPSELAAAVEEIRGDNVSGAQAITRRAAALVEDWLAGVSSEARDAEGAHRARRDIEDRLPELAAALINAHPAMAPLYNLFDSLLLCLDETAPGEDARARLARTAAAFVEGMDEHNHAIARHFSEVIDNDAAIFTHSAGSTVRAALLHSVQAGRRITVHCTESRPLCEGTALAQDLARAGIATTLTADSLAFSLLRQARDPVLAAGADAITADGVINKAGTLGLATAARSWGDSFLRARREREVPAGRVAGRPPTGAARRGNPRPRLRGTACRQPLFRPDAPRLRHRHRHRTRHRDGAGSSPRARRNGEPLSPDRRRAPGLNTRPAYANYSK